MENLPEFYNNLLAIEIAVFGIVSATIFVFIQLVYGTFSYRNIRFILRNVWLILYWILSTSGLALTATGSFFLAFENHDVIPSFDLGVNSWITNQYYAGAAIFLFGFSLASIFLFIWRNLPYLNPNRVLLLYAKEIDYNKVRDFLFKKFGVTSPDQYRFALEFGGEHTKSAEEEAKEATEAEEEYERNVRRSRRLEQGVKNAADPLAPVTDMIVNQIKRSDLKTLEEAEELICQISRKILREVPKETGQWHPEEDIPEKYTNYLIEHLETQLEICSNERLGSASRIVLDSSFCFAEALLENNYFSELDRLAEFWKHIASESIGKSPLTSIRIIRYYQQVLDYLFGLSKEQKEVTGPIRENIDVMFQDLGWLSEKLILKLPLEERPWFPDYDYTDEFDSLFNCLLRYSYEYEKYPKSYPLIYFDALEVTLLRLAKLPARDHDKRGIKEMIYSVLSDYSSFAERALENNNPAGAALSMTKINVAHRKLRELGLSEFEKYATQLMVRIGAYYAKNKSKITEKSWLGDLDGWVIKELIENHHDMSAIQDEVKNNSSYIEWDYIKELGKALRTNFGFMFDWETGETYPEDDPRRR